MSADAGTWETPEAFQFRETLKECMAAGDDESDRLFRLGATAVRFYCEKQVIEPI